MGDNKYGPFAVIFAATFKNQSSSLEALPLPTKLFSLHIAQHNCWTCKKHFASYVQGSGTGRETTEWWNTALKPKALLVHSSKEQKSEVSGSGTIIQLNVDQHLLVRTQETDVADSTFTTFDAF